MPGQLLIEYLDRQRAIYSLQSHLVAYTAPEIAEVSHIAGNNFAKVVMVKVDGVLAMVVAPANYRIDLTGLVFQLGAKDIYLACEREFSHRFPRCDIGAMPPFGHLYGLETYVLPAFKPSGEIAFNAGSHTELIRMPASEYRRLAYAVELIIHEPEVSSSRSAAAYA